MDNIVLIGMPGSGKSTVGVLLAKMLGYDFLDSDLLIQARAGKRLFEILQEDGNEAFAKLENQVNAELDVHHTVIATGGSVIYGKEAMEHLSEIGRVVYLQVSCSEMIRRIRNPETRGILLAEGMTLADLYAERAPLYEKYAQITIPCSKTSLVKTAEKIMNALEK